MTEAVLANRIFDEQRARRPAENVGGLERALSVAAGGALMAAGLLRMPRLTGLALATLGGVMTYRGVTGRCQFYHALGISSAGNGESFDGNQSAGVLHKATKVEEILHVDRPVTETYRMWQDFGRFPEFMKHVAAVEVISPTRTHWVVNGPLDTTIEWDCEVYNSRENELIAWRSLEDSEVATAGSVHFKPVGNGAQIEVQLSYQPPGGKIGMLASSLFGQDAADIIAEDLRRFKSFAEGHQSTHQDD